MSSKVSSHDKRRKPLAPLCQATSAGHMKHNTNLVCSTAECPSNWLLVRKLATVKVKADRLCCPPKTTNPFAKERWAPH